MGTIAQKLEYLNNTKQLLKENINSLGGNLTNEPFRQYASVLEGIYERLPKVSGIGASLSLSPSLMGKIKLNEIQGDTLQDSQPTPDTPVEIQSVTGLQNVEVCGKNLLDDSTFKNRDVPSNQGFFINGFSYTIKSGIYRFGVFVDNQLVTTNSIVALSFRKGATSVLEKVRPNEDFEITNEQASQINNISIYLNNTFVSTYSGKKITGVMITKSEITTYESYTGNTYEVNLGKNLFDKDNANVINGYIQASSSKIKTSDGDRVIYIPCQPNTIYTISKPVGTTEKKNRFRIGDTPNRPELETQVNNFVWSSTIDNYSNYSYTTSSTAGYLVIYIWTAGSNLTWQDMLDSIQIEKGSQATSYSPYFTPIELNKIGDYQDSIKKSTGKNLFDKDNASLLNAYINSSSSSSDYKKIISNNNARTLYIPCKSNTTYTISKIASQRFIIGSCVNLPDINTTCTNETHNNTATSLTITTGVNDNYLCVFYYLNGIDTLTEQAIRDTLMIQEGSIVSPYEPYGKVWYITKNIGKVVLDGSETWETQWNGDNIHGWRTTIPNLKQTTSGSQSSYVISNNYETRTQDENFSTGNYGISNRANQSQIIIKNNDITSVNDFKTWLGTHNTTVLYQLATPTYTEITNTELINQLESLYNAKSKDGTTNINVTSEDLSMILNVSVLKGE